MKEGIHWSQDLSFRNANFVFVLRCFLSNAKRTVRLIELVRVTKGSDWTSKKNKFDCVVLTDLHLEQRLN